MAQSRAEASAPVWASTDTTEVMTAGAAVGAAAETVSTAA